MPSRPTRRSIVVLLTLTWPVCFAAPTPGQADAQVEKLVSRVKGFAVVSLPERGLLRLDPAQALTAAKLRGVVLDDHAPVLGKPAKAYDKRMGDGFGPDAAPYVAKGIKPFRFRYFNCEFSYGGWHNFDMQDYASAHGFNVLYPYNRKPKDWTHAPKGTKWLRWGGFVDWRKWLPKHGLGELRYDQLVDMDVAGLLDKEHVFKANEGYDELMIDMEHPRPSPEKLRGMPWYPRDADAATRQAFEKKYYDGYAKTYVAPVEAARRAGWSHISLYGWQPFGRRFFGLDKVKLDPATDWAWNAFGKRVYQAVDILNPSVYCFYWKPANVAYTLANIDLNMALVNSEATHKPVRPYYWTLLHGGGAGQRWWRNQPIANEDVRAMTAMCFFTGCDGMVLWNWSGKGNHHVPSTKPGEFAMVGEEFELAGKAFERYDVLHLRAGESPAQVKFQLVEKDNPRGKYGLTEDKPVYAIARQELLPHLRPKSEPVAAMVEGLALAKAVEFLLKQGEVKVDVSAQEQFGKLLPVVRRVKCGAYHVIATYDPMRIHGGKPRHVVLRDFDGKPDLTLQLPADADTRLFILKAAR